MKVAFIVATYYGLPILMMRSKPCYNTLSWDLGEIVTSIYKRLDPNAPKTVLANREIKDDIHELIQHYGLKNITIRIIYLLNNGIVAKLSTVWRMFSKIRTARLSLA